MSNRNLPSLTTLFGGIASGALSSLLANLVAAGMGLDALHTKEITGLYISVAALITNIAGAFALRALAQRTEKAAQGYLGLALLVATIATINVVVLPPGAGVGSIALVLHYVVALSSAAFLPWFFGLLDARWFFGLLDARARPGQGQAPSVEIPEAVRLPISIAALVTSVAPQIADFNATHVYNPLWPPHARFHGVALVIAMVVFGVASLSLLWMRSAPEEHALRVRLAALLPGAIWGSFFPPLPINGVSSWPDGMAEALPVNGNLVIAAVSVGLCIYGVIIFSRARPSPAKRP